MGQRRAYKAISGSSMLGNNRRLTIKPPTVTVDSKTIEIKAIQVDGEKIGRSTFLQFIDYPYENIQTLRQEETCHFIGFVYHESRRHIILVNTCFGWIYRAEVPAQTSWEEFYDLVEDLDIGQLFILT